MTCCAWPQVERPAEIQEVVGQKRLADKVSGILERIEKELDSVEHSIGESMHVLDTDNDGMVRPHHTLRITPCLPLKPGPLLQTMAWSAPGQRCSALKAASREGLTYL